MTAPTPIAFCKTCCCFPHHPSCPDAHVPILGTFAACKLQAHRWEIVSWKNGCLETLASVPDGATLGAPRITATPALSLKCSICHAYGWADGSPSDWEALGKQMLDAPFGGKSILPIEIPNPIPYTGPARESPEPSRQQPGP